MWQRNELGLIGMVFFFVCLFFWENSFELFLKENPSSHAVNICSGINGFTQVLGKNVLICLF